MHWLEAPRLPPFAPGSWYPLTRAAQRVHDRSVELLGVGSTGGVGAAFAVVLALLGCGSESQPAGPGQGGGASGGAGNGAGAGLGEAGAGAGSGGGPSGGAGGVSEGGSGGTHTLTLGEVVPDFSLLDVNPASPTSGQAVSPRDYLEIVSGWYFGHAT